MESLLAYASDSDEENGREGANAEGAQHLGPTWSRSPGIAETGGSGEEGDDDDGGNGHMRPSMLALLEECGPEAAKRDEEAAHHKPGNGHGVKLPTPFSDEVLISSGVNFLLPSTSSIKHRAKRKASNDLEEDHGGRVRAFPHVEGNFAVHVYIPVAFPMRMRVSVGEMLERASSVVPGLNFVADEEPGPPVPGAAAVAVGRRGSIRAPSECHVSLSRTVPIRFHQIDPLVAALRRKLRRQKRFLIGFDRWACFVNDERTRTFLALEVTSEGLEEIAQQVRQVDEVFMLHKLPLFYESPRPHVSLAWVLGDKEEAMRAAVEPLNRFLMEGKWPGMEGSTRQGMLSLPGARIDHLPLSVDFCGIICKVGQREFKLCNMQFVH